MNIIQAMLAPAVMVSACGLLLLGMNNKYSLVIDRIRALHLEKRMHADTLTPARRENIDAQLKAFRKRVSMVRNAVVGYTIAVGCFILTSLGIGIQQWLSTPSLTLVAIIFFLIGMIAIFAGALFACIDAWTGYQVIMIEMEEEGRNT